VQLIGWKDSSPKPPVMCQGVLSGTLKLASSLTDPKRHLPAVDVAG